MPTPGPTRPGKGNSADLIEPGTDDTDEFDNAITEADTARQGQQRPFRDHGLNL